MSLERDVLVCGLVFMKKSPGLLCPISFVFPMSAAHHFSTNEIFLLYVLLLTLTFVDLYIDELFSAVLTQWLGFYSFL